MCKCNTDRPGAHTFDIINDYGKRITLVYPDTTHANARRSVRASYKLQHEAARRQQDTQAEQAA